MQIWNFIKRMVKEKKELNPKMREIIRILHKKGGAMTPNQIAEETGFSYVTVTKYLRDLLDKGVIIEHGNTKEKNKQTKNKK